MLKRFSLHSESLEHKFCLMLQTKHRERGIKREKLSTLAAYANYSIGMRHDATLNNDLDINKVLVNLGLSLQF